jgi:hypothetical protein
MDRGAEDAHYLIKALLKHDIKVAHELPLPSVVYSVRSGSIRVESERDI